MPLWAYRMSPLLLALLMIAVVELLSLIGLMLARRFVIPRIKFHDGVNDAVSGTVQAIGVFYGITVGLIAVGVWNTNTNSADLVSKEAAAIGVLYRDVSGYPEPLRSDLRSTVREYIVATIEKSWPAQKEGRPSNAGTPILDNLQSRLYTFEPTNPSQVALHGEALRAYNNLLEARRLRVDAVDSGLSLVMWGVIWIGAAISIGVAYLYRIEDTHLHITLVALMAGFLALVLFMIVINDKPFYGYVSISADAYKIVLEKVMNAAR